MKPSKYIITKQLQSGDVLLFSSLTTSLVTLPFHVYDEIFLNWQYSDTDVIEQLCKLGFLVNDNSQEELLEALRINEMSDKTPVVKIFTTNKCNARCYYCFEKGIKQVDMDEATARQVVSFIKKNYLSKELQINWFGGEPLYNFGIIELITRELVDDGYDLKTHITTNGSLINQQVVDFLKKYYSGISIQVTIDDLGSKYAKTKRYIDIAESEAYPTVIRNIHLLLDNGVATRIRINFLKEKIDHAFEVYEGLRSEFGNVNGLTIYFAPLSFDDDKVEEEETDNTHLKLMRFYNRNNMVFDHKDRLKDFLSSFSLKPKSIPCGSCRLKNFTITADGQLFKCHRVAKNDQYSIGNVWHGVDEQSKYYQMFISADYISQRCKDCNVYPICRGGCKIVTHILDNQEATCSIYRKHPELIEMYYNRLIKENN